MTLTQGFVLKLVFFVGSVTKRAQAIILTPHIAGWTFESKLKLSQIILKKIKDLYSK